jgi:hypothetical protein
LTDRATALSDGAHLSYSERAFAAIELAERWLSSEPLTDLLELFDTDDSSPQPGLLDSEWLHLNEDLPDWVQTAIAVASTEPSVGARCGRVLRHALAIEQRAAKHFNFRSRDGVEYRERSQAVAGRFGDLIRAEVSVCATRLGLVTAEIPTRSAYDQTLVLGGGYRSPLLRARYARTLLDRGTDLGDVYLLGSPRFMIEEPSEIAAVESYAVGPRDEFDLMVAAACAEFGWCSIDVRLVCGCENTNTPCPKWRSKTEPDASRTPPEYTHERIATLRDDAGQTRAAALSASTSRPPYRPDTSDTLEMWSRSAAPAPGDNILVVTTQVFVPFQTFDAIRRLYLPHGLNLDVVGFGADWGDRPQNAEYLLQETLSAIRSARRLLVAASAVVLNA